MHTTTVLKTWLEKALDACVNEGGTNFSVELIMYYRSTQNMPYFYVTLYKVYIFLTNLVTSLVYAE